MRTLTGLNQIGFSLSGKGTSTFHTINPASNSGLDTVFHEATTEETDMALGLAATAFVEYQKVSLEKRVAFLYDVAAELEKNAEILTDLFCLESGLPKDRALAELKRTCFQLKSYVDGVRSGYALQATIDPADPRRKPAPKPDLRKVNVPLGPIVVFGASNFPFAYSTIGGDSASALAAGCPVIVKAHAMHAGTGEITAAIVAETARKHTMPDGIFSNLNAKDFKVAEQLVKDPRVKGVGFTGSFKGGMALHKMAQEREDPIPVFSEMGSVNPIVLLPGAMNDRTVEIAKQLASSVALSAGQFCTSPGLLFLQHDSRSSEFIDLLTKELSSFGPQTMLNPSIFQSYEKGKEEQQKGAKVLLDGEVANVNRISPSANLITGEQFLNEHNRQEEVFGSYILVIVCSDEQQMRGCISHLHGHLTAGIYFSESENELASDYAAVLSGKVGRIIYNGVPTGVEVSPAMQHGGVFPATTDSRFTSVGDSAVLRWMRPVCYQNCPDSLLPDSLKKNNPLGILRFINGFLSTEHC